MAHVYFLLYGPLHPFKKSKGSHIIGLEAWNTVTLKYAHKDCRTTFTVWYHLFLNKKIESMGVCEGDVWLVVFGYPYLDTENI